MAYGDGDKTQSILDSVDEKDGFDYGDQSSSADTADDNDDNVDASADPSSNDEGVDRRTELGKQQRSNGDGREGKKDFRQQPKSERADTSKLQRLPNGNHVDARGNIVDPRDGTIIARAGAEARHFSRTQQAENGIRQRDERIRTLEQQLQQTQQMNAEPQRLGLDHEDMRVGLPIIREFKQNPVGAAKKLVEMVVGMGYNVTDILGKDAQNAVEVGGIKQMIEEQLAPLRQMQQERQRQEVDAQRRAGAERELQRFFDTNEHADLHLPAISRLIDARPDMTPESAYYEIKLFAANNGLDFSKPLQPQIDAIAGSNQRRGNEDGEINPQQRRPVPNGYGGDGGQLRHRDVRDSSGTDSWSNIIRRSMSDDRMRQ